MANKPVIHEGASGTVVIYQDDAEKIRVQALLYDETLWLTQKLLAELFDTSKQNISKHLKRIFEEGELIENSVVNDLLTTASDGKSYRTKLYNLDAVIAVGYRVNSKRATSFRIWATQILREYIVKGFAMDDERLKNPEYFLGKDYFDEMLERIRDIRSSERRFYQKITDIYAQCSVDYNQNAEITRRFFATVQNKLHWATSRQTAAEIIYSRADHTKPNMGLTTWKHAPEGRIYQSDVTIAKNYLGSEEMEKLNRLVSMYLDYAENQAKKGIPMTMADWVKRLDAFLQFNEEELLQDPQGKVSKAVADAFAIKEYQLYRKGLLEIYQSDFDLFVAEQSLNEMEKLAKP